VEDDQTINEINDQINRLRIKVKKNRLDQITRIETDNQLKIEKVIGKIDRLRIKARKDRLNKIIRITKENQLKIGKIIGKIDRLRIKARKDRLNKIQVLSDSAIIAGELGIIDNNFKKISSGKNLKSALTVAIGNNQKMPQWYLYGKNALLEEVTILKRRINDDAYIPEIVNLQNEIRLVKNDQDLVVLKNRTNDDPYTPEIINLHNKLISIESNQTLKTLESRKDDSPFVVEINKLDIEAIKLRSFELSPIGINSMQPNQYAYPTETPIKPKKRLIVALAFIAGFILSIFLVFIMNAFRNDDDKVAA